MVGRAIRGTIAPVGSVAERFKAPVLKTGEGQLSVSSNLTASARQLVNMRFSKSFYSVPLNKPLN